MGLVKRDSRSPHPRLVALYAFDLGQEGKAPTEFRIFSYGKNSSDKGDFLFDEKAADMVMSAFSKKGSRLTMDYEHQALNSAINGREAPNSAYAWTPTIRMNAEGKPELWATNVGWTDKARSMIEAKEYVHFSPTFEADPKTLRVERIVNMALTNIPALDNQEPLIAASAVGANPMKTKCSVCLKALKFGDDDNDGDEVACSAHMMGSKLSMLVGLKSDVSEIVALGAVGELVNFRNTLVTLLDVKGPGEVIGRIMALKTKEDEVKTLTSAIEADKVARLTGRFDELVKQLSADGKIPPAEIEKKVQIFLKTTGGKVTEDSLAALSLFVGEIAPKVATQADGGKKEDPSAKGAPTTLSQADIHVAGVMGLAPEDVLSFRTRAASGEFTGMKKPLFAILQPAINGQTARA